ncbi:MAG: hypothetical protein H6626_05230 [Pseudobdellovibrionaceae bacterium]|nr:MAG: hypothetical protein H6626_05230 [Pseudobdellovibrionaceae bacterium]
MYISSLPNRITQNGSYLAPYSYWNNSSKSKQTNGCGSKGLIGDLVPDSLLGTNITKVCNIHDYMYSLGEVKEYRKIADQIFLKNMFIAINEDRDNSLFKLLKKAKAYLYYLGVRIFGGEFFNSTSKSTNQLTEKS